MIMSLGWLLVVFVALQASLGFGAPQAASDEAAQQRLSVRVLEKITASIENIKAENQQLKGEIIALRAVVASQLTVQSPPVPNWAQVATAYVTGAAVLINGILALLLFQFKRQQDTYSGQAQTYLRILERMELVRADRETLREFIRRQLGENKKNTVETWLMEPLMEDLTTVQAGGSSPATLAGENREPLKEPVRTLLDRLTREFDILGFMDRKRLVNETLVNEFYAAPLADFVPIFRAYIKMVREQGERNETHLWELEQFMERTSAVRVKHPIFDPKKPKQWRRNPRAR